LVQYTEANWNTTLDYCHYDRTCVTYVPQKACYVTTQGNVTTRYHDVTCSNLPVLGT